ncbi:FAD-dependent oxidoreductase [Paenibacillus filicis]|uniref:FAD-dependent oxidoreductase n=1 Tax=Paenibacillus gyeongsangnamensis TaxID=3388067 RepID=A0ABT4QD76_9BACL|nr:FAD-dependent oxidoreductase [Paenibacillus filicis]MCZ8514630.1 FAD-dependent oxidoreductase [Paenibacillus filicis]
MAYGRSRNGKGYLVLILLAVLVVIVAGGLYVWKKGKIAAPGAAGPAALKPLEKVATVQTPKDRYDVIVVGTDPEGVAAAVSAARNGQKTLLVDGRGREILGGLMTLGWLNSLDMNYEPDRGQPKREVLNKGIFSEWHGKIEGDSFDVTTAANAFNEMVAKEKNIDVLLKTSSMAPLVEKAGDLSAVTGLKVTLADGSSRTIAAGAVIDATQDADIAAAAGVPYTTGREDIGDKKARMAVTLVFRLKNVTPDVWKQIQQRLENDNDDSTGSNAMSAWGYKDMKDYPPVNKERVAMRGLNIGRQNDNSILINALQIFGVDGLDEKSREEAFQLGKAELPHIVDYMKKKYPEFAGVELDATAPELYVRETRHIQGEYRLSILDVLENRDQWDRIAFGEYPVDIQRLSPADTGAVVTDPEQYAVPFRSLVPVKTDGLLVVGRAASYDTLPHGSARVIPVGMAEGEAAGAAVKLAAEKHMSLRELSASKEQIAVLQERLNKQGMVLKPFSLDPQPFMKHPAYEGLKTAVSLGLASGGYKNDFSLDAKSNQQRVINLLEGFRKFNPDAMPGKPADALAKGGADPKTQPVTLEQAAAMTCKLLNVPAGEGGAAAALTGGGYWKQETLGKLKNQQELTNGDTYLLLNDVVQKLKAVSVSHQP